MLERVPVPVREGNHSDQQSLETRVNNELVRLVVGSWIDCVDGIPFALLIVLAMAGWVPSIGHVPLNLSLLWFAAVTVWSVVALVMLRQYRSNAQRVLPAAWQRRLVILWFAHGVLWGLVVPTFWNHGNAQNQALLCTLMLGAIVHSFFLLYASRSVLLVNLIAITGIAELTFLYDGGSMALILALIMPPFAVLIVNNGLRLSGKYRNAIKLRFENEDMVHALEAATLAAERANRSKSEFLANMSHELRTPLNAIIGFSEVIRDRAFGDGAIVKYASYAADVASSGKHLLNLINRILDLAKIEAGKMTFEFSEFDISNLLRECARVANLKAEEKGLTLNLDDRCNDAVVRADETAIRQILLNVIFNAIKYTEHGSVRIVAETLNGMLSIEVVDTGRGISAEELTKIFMPFERADNCMSASTGGTGLGLAIVKRLVDVHGGTCAVKSQLERGTSFLIRLPILCPAQSVAAA